MSIIAYPKPALTKPALKLIVFGVKREQTYLHKVLDFGKI